MKNKPLNFDYIKQQATGKWLNTIFPAVHINLRGNGKKHQPCPLCGGTDRFRCDDKGGAGTWICNNCGAGDGVELVKRHLRYSVYDTFAQIADILGIDGGNNQISDEQRQKWQQEQQNREHEAQKQQAQNRQKAALLAQNRFDTAQMATKHPYLDKKGVQAHGLKIDEQGNLLIPLYSYESGHWTLCNIQSISPDCQGKYFIKDGQVSGACLLLGQITQNAPILIAEGYATAATLFECTNLATVVTFNSHNMQKVAPIIRKIAADCRIFGG